jgi:hypothetical protein
MIKHQIDSIAKDFETQAFAKLQAEGLMLNFAQMQRLSKALARLKIENDSVVQEHERDFLSVLQRCRHASIA